MAFEGCEGGRRFERFDSGRKAPTAVALVLLMLVSGLLAPALHGCGSGGVEFYLGQASRILADLNAKAGELKKLWSVPVAEMGGYQETLAAYRQALGSAQENFDRNDPPKPCRRLDELMRRAVDQGRELADINAPFADYGEYIAPVAVTMNEIVASLESLRSTDNQSAGLAGLQDKCGRLETEVRTIVPPGTFQGIHDELLAFTHMVGASIGDAMGVSVPKPQVRPPEEQETEEETGRASARAEQRQYRQTLSALAEIPELWQSFNGKLSALMEVARQVTGLKSKNGEVENAIAQAVEEMKKLEGK